MSYPEPSDSLFIESLPLSIRTDVQLRISRINPNVVTLSVVDASEFVMVDLDLTDLGNLIGILEMAEQALLKKAHSEK